MRLLVHRTEQAKTFHETFSLFDICVEVCNKNVRSSVLDLERSLSRYLISYVVIP